MIVHEDRSVTIFKSELYETVSTVVRTDDLVLVVDPAWLPREVAEIREYVRERLAGRPLYLLFTHSDYDHIIGCGAFAGATVLASDAFNRQSEADKRAIVEQILTFDDDYYISRDYAVHYPTVDCAFEKDGEKLKVGGTSLTFYQAPGHNGDGLFTVVEPLGLLLAGDYFSDVEFPYIYHGSAAYEESAAKLETILDAHAIGMLVPGHGNAAVDRADMLKRMNDSLDYIRSLRDAVARDDRTAAEALIAGCRFPRNMRKFHHANMELIKKELAGKG